MFVAAWIACLFLTASPARADVEDTIGPSFHRIRIRTDDGRVFKIDAPALTIRRLGGAPWGFSARISVMFPTRIGQDGRAYAVKDYYGNRLGLDLGAGVARRVSVGRTWMTTLAAGPHIDYLSLQGKTGYADFSSLTGGLEIDGCVRWQPGVRLLRHPLVLSAGLSSALDFIDFMRGGDLDLALAVGAGLALGLSFQ
jgi:hypothetical protein